MQSKSYIFDISNCYGSNEACGVKSKVFKAFSDISPTQSVSQTGNKSVKRRDEREIKRTNFSHTEENRCRSVSRY